MLPSATGTQQLRPGFAPGHSIRVGGQHASPGRPSSEHVRVTQSAGTHQPAAACNANQ